MRSNTGWIIVILILLAVIAVMAWFLFATPVPLSTSQTATSTTQSTSTTGGQTPTGGGNTVPLSSKVKVSSPVSGAKVGKSFTVTGEAPGGWYFEAVFPIQVRDANNNVIAHAQGQAQSDWMTTKQVAFKSNVIIETDYKGSATLVILRDNPSGLPENDDSVSVPIVIQ
jgi:hypothetical protein